MNITWPKLWTKKRRNPDRLSAGIDRNRNFDETNLTDPTFSSSLYITPGAVVCVEAEVRGEVRIGTRSVVHPCAKILATNGPIVMGESNIVEELVVIENK